MCMVILRLVYYVDVIFVWLHFGWSVPLKLYVYGILRLVCSFEVKCVCEVACVWLYCGWSVPLKLYVYGYIAAVLVLWSYMCLVILRLVCSFEVTCVWLYCC